MSFQRGLNEGMYVIPFSIPSDVFPVHRTFSCINLDGRDCIDIVNKVSEFLYTNGLNLLSEHDKLNIEGIGLAKSMVLFITRQYLAKENYGLDKELMRRYINRKGERYPQTHYVRYRVLTSRKLSAYFKEKTNIS